MRVETAKPRDARTIAELHVRAWSVAYRGLIPDVWLDSMSLADHVAHFERRLAERTRHTLVCRDDEGDEGVRGWLGMRLTSRTLELEGLYVDPAFLRRGIGTSLWRQASLLATAEGARTAAAWVVSLDERARSFYAALGFGERPGHFRELERGGKALRELRYERGLKGASST